MLGNMVYNIDIETCSFSLNYAFIHVFCCVAQYILHVRVGRCQHFAVSHAFALFALTMDYGFSYMKNGSRTLSYRNPDDEHLGPLGTFLFFFWFDYSAFGIIIWAKEIETKIQFVLKRGLKETIQSFTLTHFSLLSILPLQFWIAPSLSRRLALDSRELLLSRKSHKEGYALALFFSRFRRISTSLTRIGELGYGLYWLPGSLAALCITHHYSSLVCVATLIVAPCFLRLQLNGQHFTAALV